MRRPASPQDQTSEIRGYIEAARDKWFWTETVTLHKVAKYSAVSESSFAVRVNFQGNK
jgi:hypothetical protein